MNFSPDGKTVATGSADGTVRLWNDHGVPLGMLKGKGSHPRGLRFDPNGLLLVVLSDGTMRLWDVDSRQVSPARMDATSYRTDTR